MKTLFTRFVLLGVILLTTLSASAYDAEIDGIYYNLDTSSKTASVTYYSLFEYSPVYAGFIDIPSTVSYNGSKYSVTSIGEWAFYHCKDLTSVTIPNSVTSIGICAFAHCSSLTSVTMGNSLTSVENGAFSDCVSLISITIPNSVTNIGVGSFSGCTDLTSITIPNSVKSIGIRAFSYCSNLKRITLSNKLQSIPSYTFEGCSSLTSITIPNSVTSIELGAFYGCSGLYNVIIPNSVTSIGVAAFQYCSSLTDIIIPKSVTSIRKEAFAGCSNLTSVIIPKSVTSIGTDAFQYCTNLPVENGIRYADCVAVEAIDKQTRFATIKEGTRFIHSSAFYGCTKLTSITIPSSVTNIGSEAFVGCNALVDLTCLSTTPPAVSSDCFSHYGTLHVPSGSKTAYETADIWKNFTIEEIDVTAIEQADANNTHIVGTYTLDGKRSTTPQRGVRIIRYSDGTTKKVI